MDIRAECLVNQVRPLFRILVSLPITIVHYQPGKEAHILEVHLLVPGYAIHGDLSNAGQLIQ